MFRVRSLQVGHGDSVLVSYAGDNGRERHLLVDGGPADSRDTLLKVFENVRRGETLRLEAWVITHYDLDHIQGVIELLRAIPAWLEIGDIWFNGYHHLQPTDKLGPIQANELSALIRSRGLRWNASFYPGRNNREVGAIHQGCIKIRLPGGLDVEVVSPDEAGLKALAKVWTDPQSPPPDERAVPTDRLGRGDHWPPPAYDDFVTRPFRADRSIPNLSSIALLLTFAGKRVLLAADALPSVIVKGLQQHLPGRQPIDLLKVSHHGSRGNTDQILLSRIGCRRFLISTNGEKHFHPDFDLIALLLKGRNTQATEISFNHASEWTGRWKNKPQSWRFTARYPNAGELFVDVLL